MKTFSNLVVISVSSMFLASCGSAVKESYVSESFPKGKPYKFMAGEVKMSVEKESKYLPPRVVPEILKAYLEIELAKLNAVNGSGIEDVIDVNVDIVDYRDKGGFNRVFWGPFSGSDYLESEVHLMDGKTREDLGMIRVKSEDAWGIGIDGVAKMHAEKIAQELKNIVQSRPAKKPKIWLIPGNLDFRGYQ